VSDEAGGNIELEREGSAIATATWRGSVIVAQGRSSHRDGDVEGAALSKRRGRSSHRDSDVEGRATSSERRVAIDSTATATTTDSNDDQLDDGLDGRRRLSKGSMSGSVLPRGWMVEGVDK